MQKKTRKGICGQFSDLPLSEALDSSAEKMLRRQLSILIQTVKSTLAISGKMHKHGNPCKLLLNQNLT